MKKKILGLILFFCTIFSIFGNSLIGCWYTNDLNGWSRWAKIEYAITDKDFKLRDPQEKKQTIYPYKIVGNKIILSEPKTLKEGFPRMTEMSFEYEIKNENFIIFKFSSDDILLVNGKYINTFKSTLETTGFILIATGAAVYAGGKLIDYLLGKKLNDACKRYANYKVPESRRYKGESGGENLSKNMEEFLGQKQPNNTQTAHIIAKKDPRFAPLRNILNQVGIDLNHVANGVWLPNNQNMADKFGTYIHNNGLSETHTQEYVDTLTNNMEAAVGVYMENDGLIKPEYRETAKLEVIKVLIQTGQACLSGGW